MSSAVQSICRIIAGPNGAGKTTFALKYLPEVAAGSAFVNADLIAAGLSPLAPEQQQMAASRLFLREIERAIQAGRDFAFETTLAGRGYLRLIERLRTHNWRIELIYLALPSVEMSALRVAERVRHGGHNIPQTAIERRFVRSLRNLLGDYGDAANEATCFMNIGASPDLVFNQQGTRRDIHNLELFDHLMREAKP
ncbi:MAG: zeta toxin family protein [Candidatus Competibacter sp.]